MLELAATCTTATALPRTVTGSVQWQGAQCGCAFVLRSAPPADQAIIKLGGLSWLAKLACAAKSKKCVKPKKAAFSENKLSGDRNHFFGSLADGRDREVMLSV